jgi:ATP-dependent Lon protease
MLNHTVLSFKPGVRAPGRRIVPVLRTSEVLFPNIVMNVVIDASQLALDKDVSTLEFFAIENDASDITGAVGTVATIVNRIPETEGMDLFTVHTLARARVVRVCVRDIGDAVEIVEFSNGESGEHEDKEIKAELLTAMRTHFEERPELTKQLEFIEELAVLTDAISDQANFAKAIKLELLNAAPALERARILLKYLRVDPSVVTGLREDVQAKVQQRMDKAQREYYLREQLRVLQVELGQDKPEITDLERRLKNAGVPAELSDIANRELAIMANLERSSSEFISRFRYVDWLAALPWKDHPIPLVEPRFALKVLNDGFYGQDEIKEWVVQELALSKLLGKPRGQAICFIGPPGVGKTGLGHAIARALGRPFIHVSLGGLGDETLIRGRSRGYMEARPGLLARALRAAGSKSPVILLDEIDKLGKWPGDPRAALLEAMDPTSGNLLFDHFIEWPVSFSSVLFIATANDVGAIYPPLLSRMRQLHFFGYDQYEKFEIARRFLVPDIISASGVTRKEVELPDDTLHRLVRNYTREAGVRSLRMHLESICRQVAKKRAEGYQRTFVISPESLSSYLGPMLYFPYSEMSATKPGRTHVATITHREGATIIPLDCVAIRNGSGKLTVIGEEQAPMLEATQIAVAVLRATPVSGLRLTDIDVHIHARATARDTDEALSWGPSLYMAMRSAISGVPVPSDLSCIGRLTLLGEIAGVPHVPAKLAAAQRFGIRRVALAEENRVDADATPRRVTEELELHFVSDVDQLNRFIAG